MRSPRAVSPRGHTLSLPQPPCVRARVPAAPSPPLGLLLSLFRTSPLLTAAWGHLVVVLIRVSRRTEMQRVLPWARCRLFSASCNGRRVLAASRGVWADVQHQPLRLRSRNSGLPAALSRTGFRAGGPSARRKASRKSDTSSAEETSTCGERGEHDLKRLRRDTVLTVWTRTDQEPGRVSARSPKCDPALFGILA